MNCYTLFSMKVITLVSSLILTFFSMKGEAKPQIPFDQLYTELQESLDRQDLKSAKKSAESIVEFYKDHPMSPEVYYQLASLYLKEGEYEAAYEAVQLYLLHDPTLRYYEEAYRIKLEVAHRFAKGFRKHVAGLKVLPKWAPAQEEAIDIYDEVQGAVPRSELAAEALYAKGVLQLHLGDSKSALDSFQVFLKKFGTHALAPHAHIKIGDIYIDMTKAQANDDVHLSLERLNYHRFRDNFPSDPRLRVAEGQIRAIEEILADGMYEIAAYYKRTNRPDAALLYYTQVVQHYPKSVVAHKAVNTIEYLREKHADLKDKYPIEDLEIVVDVIEELPLSAEEQTNPKIL
ncbi:MAG: outer membrane protein assembly factor BamD [Chlamydiia bacterium]